MTYDNLCKILKENGYTVKETLWLTGIYVDMVNGDLVGLIDRQNARRLDMFVTVPVEVFDAIVDYVRIEVDERR